MCCFVLLVSALGRRFVIVGMWLFGNRVDAAFGSGLWPLLGLLLAPWTTLMYLHVATDAAKPAQSRYATV